LLFRRDIEPSCSYCQYGTSIGFGEVVCKKRGIMSSIGNCDAFRYEPTKREPEFTQSVQMTQTKAEDFSLL